MSITLPTYSNGDIDYVAKLNQTAAVVEGQLNSLQNQMSAAAGASISVGSMVAALLGPNVAIIGSTGCLATGSGTVLTMGQGYVWLPDSSIVVLHGSGTINFAGAPAATYYVDIDASGAVSRQSSQSALTLWSVVWTGSAFGAMTRVAPALWDYADQVAAQNSTAFGATYVAPDARFEAGESRIVSAETRLGTLESAARPYDLTLWQAGKPDADQVLMKAKLARAVTFAANFSGSTAAPADVAATADTVFSINKNGAQVGTATYAAGSTSVTFASTGAAAVSFAVGDVLTVVAPASQDATLSGVAIVLAGGR